MYQGSAREQATTLLHLKHYFLLEAELEQLRMLIFESTVASLHPQWVQHPTWTQKWSDMRQNQY